MGRTAAQEKHTVFAKHIITHDLITQTQFRRETAKPGEFRDAEKTGPCRICARISLAGFRGDPGGTRGKIARKRGAHS